MRRRFSRFFLQHRELLGEMARLAYDTAREMMAAAVDEPDARPGMLGVIQTFSSSLNWNPHTHSIVSRGVWTHGGEWMPVPYVDEHRAELLFRHKLLTHLRARGLISQERIDLLLSWRHSRFSVHNGTTVYPSDTEGLHTLACYLMRAPVNVSRLRFDPESRLLVYQPKPGHQLDDGALTDPLEFLARILTHIPLPNNSWFVSTAPTQIASDKTSVNTFLRRPHQALSFTTRRQQTMGRLIYRIYEVDPLT